MTRSKALPLERLPRFMVAAVAGCAVGAIPLAALMAQDRGNAPFTHAETGQGFERLQDAVDAIGSGRGTILIANGARAQCAVQEAGSVTYRARNFGEAVLSGQACEGKAALVLRGEDAFVAGVVFADMAVDDGNGAGIRLENGNLTVIQSWFRDSQQGILTAAGDGITMRIDKSTFTRLGTCENSAGCAHSIYAGDVRSVAISRSRFEAGTGGHYVKSRAAETVVEDSSFDDSAGRGTNYMIDLPNGGKGRIVRNWFVQGRDKENWSAYVAVGAEGAGYSADGLTIASNDARPVPGLRRSTAFVADWTGDRLDIRGNELGAGLKEFERR